jgi:hypothetical protein
MKPRSFVEFEPKRPGDHRLPARDTYSPGVRRGASYDAIAGQARRPGPMQYTLQYYESRFTNFVGAGARGFVGNLYLPAGFNDLSPAETRIAIALGGFAAQNLLREFTPRTVESYTQVARTVSSHPTA